MILAHLPSGHLLSPALKRRLGGKWLMLAVTLGAVLPDLDMIWRVALIPAIGFLAAVLLHLVLDTVAGHILWSWSDRFFHLINVPAKFDPWLLNLVLIPLALVELAIITAAVLLWRQNQRPLTP